MFAVDLHTHTRFFHGFAGRPTAFDPVGARLLAAVARWRGLDGVAVTNHDYYEAVDVGGPALAVIPGNEISTTAGHVLVVGPDPPSRTAPRKHTPAEVVEMARDGGCAAVIAHPFRDSTVRDSDAAFDAVEVNGKRGRSTERLRRLADERGVPLVGGSDAHYPVEAGRAYTLVDPPGDELTPGGVVAAIRAGDVAYHVDQGLPSRLARRLYALVHRLRGHE